MSYKIRCYTLFDVTKTGVLNRKAPITLSEEQRISWEKQRNSQCNYDTVLQVVNLRCQPEDLTNTVQFTVNFKEFKNFGFLYEDEDDQNCWYFDFTISHKSVFDNGISELGSLYEDCEGVPMIKQGTEWSKLPLFLDASPELRNIYFEVLTNE
jgi:hypothetical protein